jgi:hypothetical protein
VRFLTQATFGASTNDIASVQSLGYAGWLANQFSLPATHALTNVLAHPYSDPTDFYQSPLWFNTWWQNSITAPDQLRQRVAFALSEFFCHLGKQRARQQRRRAFVLLRHAARQCVREFPHVAESRDAASRDGLVFEHAGQ